MGSRRWKIPAGAITTILMSSGPHLHLKGCPEFLFCARTRLGDQRIKLWTCMDYWCSHFLFSVLLKERNLIDCAVRSCSFRIGIRACSGLSSIMLFKNIPGVDVALKIQITFTLIVCIVALQCGTNTLAPSPLRGRWNKPFFISVIALCSPGSISTQNIHLYN